MYDRKQKSGNAPPKNELSDTPQAILFLFLDILACCFDLLNEYISRYCTTFSFVKVNASNTLKFRGNALNVSLARRAMVFNKF